jgi:hypothetical protein
MFINIAFLFFQKCFEQVEMNLELLESFGQNYPEEFDGSLDCISMAVTCQFNRYVFFI